MKKITKKEWGYIQKNIRLVKGISYKKLNRKANSKVNTVIKLDVDTLSNVRDVNVKRRVHSNDIIGFTVDLESGTETNLIDYRTPVGEIRKRIIERSKYLK